MKKDRGFACIETENELRELTGEPSRLVKNKTVTSLDNHCKLIISLSPFVVLSTSDNDGFTDVSPRGDSPGFVHVHDDEYVIIPDRPGNKRMDSIRNILSNPRAGLLFIIPGWEETLRVNGKAEIINDKLALEPMSVNGKPPSLGIGIEIEECFVHCAKAFKRSLLWQPESWPDKEVLPKAARILADHAKLPGVGEIDLKEALRKSYTDNLY